MADSVAQRLAENEREKATEKRMPTWIEPMLAQLTDEPLSDPDWLYELKLDGERVLAFKSGDDVRLMSRNRKRLNDSYPELEEAIARRAPGQCILDGEVAAFDSENVSDFQRLQPRMHASRREVAKESGVKVSCYLFDCLYIDGHDISRVALRARKNLLRGCLDWHDPLRWMQHRNEKGLGYLEEACAKGWEGLIAKNAGSPYVHGRSRKWLKLKCTNQQELVIGGFTDPRGQRVGLGALLLGFYRKGDLVYAGKAGTGFDDETLESLRRRLERIERKTSPFDKGEPESKGVHFVTPNLVCEIAFNEWTERRQAPPSPLFGPASGEGARGRARRSRGTGHRFMRKD